MRNRLVLAALATMSVGGQALAEGISYTYLQGSLIGTRIKAGGESDGGKGFRLEGAISNDQPIFGFFNFARHKYPSSSENLKFTNASAGVGVRLSLASSVDLVGGLSFETIKIQPFVSYSAPVPPPQQPSDSDSSRNGIGLSAGLKGSAGSRIEWNAGVKYRRIEHIDPIVGISAGARYSVTPAIAVGVDAFHEKFDKDTLDATESTVAFAVRYQFGAGR